MKRTIDLNCDLGESFGAWTLGQDGQIISCISSTSIACGFHAGDPQIMRHTVALARQHGVAVGAHPGLPDLQGFGRRELVMSADEVYALVLYQIGALAAFARAAGGRLGHVKPHGALYNMAARDGRLAAAVAAATRDFDPQLVLFGLANSRLIEAGREHSLRVANEAFADRSYEADGSLTPRGERDAVLADPDEAAQRVIEMVQGGRVRSRQGTWVPLLVDTICLHGDRPDAALFAQAVRQRLDAAGLSVRAPFADAAES